MKTITKISVAAIALVGFSGTAMAQDAVVEDQHYRHSHMRDVDVIGLEATGDVGNADGAKIEPGVVNGISIGYGAYVGQTGLYPHPHRLYRNSSGYPS